MKTAANTQITAHIGPVSDSVVSTRLKELERENGRLKRAVANLTLDKLILEEAAKGNF